MEWRGQEIYDNEANGWIMVCESPLELEHEQTRTHANGLAAIAIMDDLLYQKNNPKP